MPKIALSWPNDYPARGLVLASGYYFPTGRLDVWIMSGPAIPISGRRVSLYNRSRRFMRYSTDRIPKAVLAPLCPAKVQKGFSVFVDTSPQRRIALETNELNALDIANGFPPVIRSGRSVARAF
jgi:hypothetical protein